MFQNSSVQNYGAKDSNGDADLIYYNADIINGNATNSLNIDDDPFVEFNDTRTVPLLNNAENYEFSIIRFQINGANKNLPLFVPQIELGQSDINKTTYTLGIKGSTSFTVGGTTYSFVGYAPATMYFVPENLTYGLNTNTIALPQPPLKTQDLTTDYYFVYTYDHVVVNLNATIKTAYDLLNSQLRLFWVSKGGTGTAPTFTTQCPYLTFDSSNVLFNAYYDSYGFGGSYARSYGKTGLSTPVEALSMYFNNNLMGLFSSFDSLFVDYDTYVNANLSPSGAGYTKINDTEEPNKLNVFNKVNTNIYTPPNPAIVPPYDTLATSYYVMAQNYTNTSTLWSPISSIVFTSTQLPVKTESASNPVRYGKSNDGSVSSNASGAFSPIIADIGVNVKQASDYCNLIYYEPNAEYKMTSLKGGSNSKITNIDIKVFWKNRLDNKLYPIRMYNYSNVSIKMMFRRKKD